MASGQWSVVSTVGRLHFLESFSPAECSRTIRVTFARDCPCQLPSILEDSLEDDVEAGDRV